MLRRFLLMKAFPRKVDCGLLTLRLTAAIWPKRILCGHAHGAS
jgi:hypothetical protein